MIVVTDLVMLDVVDKGLGTVACTHAIKSAMIPNMVICV